MSSCRVQRPAVSALLPFATATLLAVSVPVDAGDAQIQAASNAETLRLKKAALGSGAHLDASDEVIAALAAGQPQMMLIEINSRKITETDPPRENEHATMKQELVDAVSAQGATREMDYAHLPMMAMTVKHGNALLALMRNPHVKAVYENQPHEAFLTESLPLIHQSSAAALVTLDQVTVWPCWILALITLTVHSAPAHPPVNHPLLAEFHTQLTSRPKTTR